MTIRRFFSCGAQSLDWLDTNCHRCAKDVELRAAGAEPKCEIRFEIARQFWTSDQASPEMWKRSGAEAAGNAYVWDCPEREPVK